MRIEIDTPPNFNFWRTVMSHGWSCLLPFWFDKTTRTLSRVLEVGQGRPAKISISASGSGLRVLVSRQLGEAALQKVVRDVRRMLRLDEDISPFYLMVEGDPEFAWIARKGAGRLLRSPTVFEDVVKMVCTTNCSWALTDKMVTGIVERLGRETARGRRSFPTPSAMAAEPVRFYRDEIRGGYRAPYLKELADRVASGELDPEQWLSTAMPTAQLKREMKRVKGIGDYAAENLLKLVGRYDGLALDSWVRAKFSHVRNRGRQATDKRIEHFYSRFDSWRGLALWCDLTKDWLE